MSRKQLSSSNTQQYNSVSHSNISQCNLLMHDSRHEGSSPHHHQQHHHADEYDRIKLHPYCDVNSQDSNKCRHDYEIPQPKPRSFSMNRVLSADQQHHDQTTQHPNDAFKSARTCPRGLSSDDVNHTSCFKHVEAPSPCRFQPYATDGRHRGQQRQRRSIASSGSDDPIATDLSSSAASSYGNPASLVRSTAGRRLVRGNAIPEHDHRMVGEEDLEVERLTTVAMATNDTMKTNSNGSQRDSAFYQSYHDINHGTPSVSYSSPSSGCSPEMTNCCGDNDGATTVYYERTKHDNEICQLHHSPALLKRRKDMYENEGRNSANDVTEYNPSGADSPRMMTCL